MNFKFSMIPNFKSYLRSKKGKSQFCGSFEIFVFRLASLSTLMFTKSKINIFVSSVVNPVYSHKIWISHEMPFCIYDSLLTVYRNSMPEGGGD